jgi:hypothetical protein
MVFEKRLDAHQGAYYWCMRLLKVIRPHRLMKDGGPGVVVAEWWEATEWLNKNALYLDEGSRAKMNDFLYYISVTSPKYLDEKEKNKINVEEELRNLVTNLGDVLSSIKKGVGAEYLPEVQVSGGGMTKGARVWNELVESTEELIGREKK